MKTITKLAIAAAAFAPAIAADISASHAFGDAQWCAVVEIGSGEVEWDCRYRTVEECVPNVLAGNRGFCNLNPAWRGPNAVAATERPSHGKRHTLQH